MTAVIRTLDLPNRVTLEYVEHGDPHGVPVLLLHGYTDSWRSFERVLPHLPGSLRAFALSQRGHGGSERPAKDYAPDDFVADVAAFMDRLGIGSALVVGHCMGSWIAQRFALAHPDRTRGLVLLGAVFSMQGNLGVVELWQAAVSTLSDPIDPAFVREFQESTVAQPVPEEFLDRIVGESLKVPASVWRATLNALLDADVPGDPGRIDAPTLLVWGDRDSLCSRSDQEALRRAIAGSRLLTYTGAGHSLHWEEPARIAAAIAAFARDLLSPPRAVA